jgi:hypothetical protein
MRGFADPLPIRQTEPIIFRGNIPERQLLQAGHLLIPMSLRSFDASPPQTEPVSGDDAVLLTDIEKVGIVPNPPRHRDGLTTIFVAVAETVPAGARVWIQRFGSPRRPRAFSLKFTDQPARHSACFS